MSTDTITNFIKSTNDVMSDVKSRLDSSKKYNKVSVYAGNDWTSIWKTLSSMMSGSAIIAYTGSEYQLRPRRSLKFSVVVVIRSMKSDEIAQEKVMKLIDDTISLIDHEVYDSSVIYKVLSDGWLEYGNATLSVYKIDFKAEDY